jgi:hypothetical protein
MEKILSIGGKKALDEARSGPLIAAIHPSPPAGAFTP